VGRSSLLVYWVLPLVLIWQGSSCHSSNSNTRSESPRVNNSNSNRPSQAPLSGQWGGQHISLVIGDDASDVEYDCAHGRFTGPIVANAEGKFSVAGTYVREQGGAMRVDEPAEEQRVIYKGQITGETMTLSVTLADGNQVIDTYTLKRGQTGRVRKCM
jgi:hypothetical protein